MDNGICLLVEDHIETRDFLTGVIIASFPGMIIHVASSLREAKDWLGKRQAQSGLEFNLAIVDLGLPDGSGIEIIEQIKQKEPTTKIVVVTIYDEDSYLFEALKAGASGYLLKSDRPSVLIDLLKRLRNDEPPLSPAIARRLLAHFRTPAPEVTEDSDLSARERETLTLLSRGLTVAEAAKSMGLSPQTVAGYVKIIYQKLHVSNRVELLHEASRRGLV